MVKCFLTRVLRPFNGERTVFSTNGAGETGYPHTQKKEVEPLSNTVYKNYLRASLVAQWLRVCLPMQGTRVPALVWEDPACRAADGPVVHNC